MTEGPYERLRRLRERGEARDAALPAQDDSREEWSGVGFRIGGRRFVGAMGEVTEILAYPDLSRIPHSKAWVRGIANVRGNLLPVMDLSGYLGRGRVTLNRSSRVLVIDQEGVVAGLLVEEVLGLRRFYIEQWRGDPGDEDVAVAPYITGLFQRDDGAWPVFSMARLARHPEFLKVADQ